MRIVLNSCQKYQKANSNIVNSPPQKKLSNSGLFSFILQLFKTSATFYTNSGHAVYNKTRFDRN